MISQALTKRIFFPLQTVNFALKPAQAVLKENMGKNEFAQKLPLDHLLKFRIFMI